MGKKVKKKTHTKRNVLVTVGIVVVLAIIAGLILFFSRTPDNVDPSTVRQTIGSTEVGKTITAVTPKAELLSEMVVPATQAWWTQLGKYNVTLKLPAKLDSFGATPRSVGVATVYYPDNQLTTKSAVGSPTVFLAFKNEDEAVKAQQAWSKQQNTSTVTGALVKGNYLIISLNGVYVDKAFLYDQIKQSPASKDVTKGYWIIHWDVLNKFMNAYQSKTFQTTYAKVLSELGYNNKAENPAWYGTSTDGLTWVGTNSSTNNMTVWNMTKAAPAKLLTTLQSTAEVVTSTTDPNEKSVGILIPNQSAILTEFAVSSSTQAIGAVVNSAGKSVAVKKETNPNLLTVTLNPSLWIQAMAQTTNEIVNLTDYRKATLTFQKQNLNNLTIRFSDLYAH